MFVPGEAAVKIDTKQFGAADGPYNLILDSLRSWQAIDVQACFISGNS